MNRRAAALGVVLLAIGALILFELGGNYPACQYAGSPQPGCPFAAYAHMWGIIIMVTGGVVLALGLLADRNNEHGHKR